MNIIRPLVQRLSPYAPGEQPKIKGLVKLNTNENPYPPSAKVLAAVKAAVDDRLRLYPNPTAHDLRVQLARYHGCQPDQIIVGNGSDELLALVTRCFVEPVNGCFRNTAEPSKRAGRSAVPVESMVQFFSPCYSLYPVLAAIHGAVVNEVPLHPDFSLPILKELRRGGRWQARAALTFVTTPNAPSGRAYPTVELEALCQAHQGVLVLDEAYVDFARENALALALKHPHVLVARTFSKAFSLCFQRVGYMVGNIDLIGALHKIRDSYNVNGLGQIAALATLRDLPYYQTNFRRIQHTRERLIQELVELGFTAFPSQSNFILVRPPEPAAQTWLEKLRERKVLVRWFPFPQVRDYLRITVGTEAQTDKILRAVKSIL